MQMFTVVLHATISFCADTGKCLSVGFTVVLIVMCYSNVSLCVFILQCYSLLGCMLLPTISISIILVIVVYCMATYRTWDYREKLAVFFLQAQ